MDLLQARRYVSAALAAVVGLATLYMMLTSGSTLFVLIGVLAIVACCVGAFMYVRRWQQQQKILRDHVSSTNLSTDDPRARLVMLRENFNRGMQQFSSVGKGIYSLPWYLVVGENGTGKSEAIRRSGLGFPPGLQDGMLGTGGDEALNWWFTNQAVFLDVPGDWIYKGEDDSPDSEWMELCKLLAAHRSQSPFNGIVLAYSAEKLIADSAETAKEKAGKLARRLARTQRALELRFPLYVVVTKSDKLVGFREFFDRASEAERKHIFGWTNPAAIEERYDPEALPGQLAGVLDALKRKQVELLSAIPIDETTSKPKGGWADAVQAFPSHLARTFPNLQRHLEPIFQLGEWSTRPLFLRGIYFTSAVRKGGIIDPEARDAFALPLEVPQSEDEPETVDKTYFLHELFVKKAFEEKGLLMHASGATVSRRLRRVLPWAFGIASVVLLIFLTFLSSSKLKAEIGAERASWEAAAEKAQWKAVRGRWGWRPVVEGATPTGSTFTYHGTETIMVGEGEQTVADFLVKMAARVEEPFQLPWTFRFTNRIKGDLSRRRLEAARALFESGVLSPVVGAALQKLQVQGSDQWDAAATEALQEVLRMQVQATLKNPADAGEGVLKLDALFRYVLKGAQADFDRYQKSHAAGLSEALTKLYAGRNAGEWPPKSLDICGIAGRQATARGVKAFASYWDNQMGANKMSRFFADIASLTEAGEGFLKAEEALLGIAQRMGDGTGLPATMVAHNVLVGEWERQFVRLAVARDVINANEKLLESGQLQEKYKEIAATTFAAAEAAINGLKLQTNVIVEKGVRDGMKESVGLLAQIDRDLGGRLDELKRGSKQTEFRKGLEKLDKQVFAPSAEVTFGKRSRAFDARFELYGTAEKQLTGRVSVPGLYGLAAAVKKLDEDVALARSAIQRQQSRMSGVPLIAEAAESALFALRLAERSSVFQFLKAALDNGRDAPEGIAGVVTGHAKTLKAAQRPKVPLTGTQGGEFGSAFNQEAARALLAERQAIDSLLGATDAQRTVERQGLAAQYAKLASAFDLFFTGYMTYWADAVEAGLAIQAPEWQAFFAALGEAQPWQINDGIKGVMQVADEALAGFEKAGPAEVSERVSSVRRRIQAGRERVSSELFRAKCQDILRKWSVARTKPDEVRAALLKATPVDFLQEYMITGGTADADYVLRYWQDLTQQALVGLADQFQAQAAERYPVLKTLELFPFAAPGEQSLGAMQVFEAHQVFDRIRLNRGELPDGSVGKGSPTGNARIDDVLTRLVMGEVPEQYREWFLKADAVLDGLPDQKAFECEVSLVGAEEQKGLCDEAGVPFQATSALRVWRALGLRQGGRLISRPVKTEQPQDLAVGKLLYPGDDVRLEFYKFIDQPPDKAISQPGPWGCVAFLHTFGAKRMKDDGRQWIVGVSTKDDVGRDRVLWLRLAFARALPQIADWPSARYATPVAAAGKRFVPSGKRTQDASLKIAADEEYQSLQRMFADGKIDDVLALAEAAAGRFGGTEFAKQFVQLRDDIRAKKAEKDKPAAPAGPKIVAGSIGIQLAFVPGGEYVLGDGAGEQDEKPEGKITVGAYFISVHEITNAQFERFDSRRTRTNYSKEDNAPVVNVSHKDAVAFCEWLSKQERVVYRLPTEAEWEIAARGTDQRTYPWGNDGPDAGGTYRANYRQGADPAMASADGFASVSPVGSYPQGASPFGCLDMAGNVWEWCSDWYAEDYYQKRPATNPKGPARGQERVLRGGSWYHSAALARSANRHKLTPTNPQPTVGFRVVREAPSYNVE